MSALFAGFTVLAGIGYWKNTQEPTLVIEILGSSSDKVSVVGAAQQIKKTNKQEAVLVTWTSVHSNMI
jgi:hypothetical protein